MLCKFEKWGHHDQSKEGGGGGGGKHTCEWMEPLCTGFSGQELQSHELPLSEETPLLSVTHTDK